LKKKEMTVLALKKDIIARIEKLDDVKLRQLSGFINNIQRLDDSYDEWNKLSEKDQKELLSSLRQSKIGQTHEHKSVFDELRQKLKND
jgi:hypothetical protein